MKADDWSRVMDRRPWQETDLYELRIRYAALLSDVHAHRQAMWDKDVTEADARLWAALERERFGG